MTVPKFIDIDGKRHLWRDIVKLRQEQLSRGSRSPTGAAAALRIARGFPTRKRTQRSQSLSRTIAVFLNPKRAARDGSLGLSLRIFSQQALSHEHSISAPLETCPLVRQCAQDRPHERHRASRRQHRGPRLAAKPAAEAPPARAPLRSSPVHGGTPRSSCWRSRRRSTPIIPVPCHVLRRRRRDRNQPRRKRNAASRCIPPTSSTPSRRWPTTA